MRILYLYNWKLKDVEKELNEIYNQGFDTIQLSTIQTLKNCNPDNWWNSLDVSSYHMGNNFGTKDELISLCQKAKINCIKIAIEIVPIFNTEVHFISDINPHLLKIREKNILSEKEQVEIYYLLYKLIHYGVDGIFFNFNKIEFPKGHNNFFQNVAYFLQSYNINCLNIFNFDDYSYYNYIEKTRVKYIECPFGYYDFNFGFTRTVDSQLITSRYKKLCQNYEDTLYYARPFDDEWKSDEVKEANYSYVKKYRKDA